MKNKYAGEMLQVNGCQIILSIQPLDKGTYELILLDKGKIIHRVLFTKG
ncbi:hypothetical protein [Algoriphagus sp.]|nr:hypothetical protein [Algoriphagus sp.]